MSKYFLRTLSVSVLTFAVAAASFAGETSALVPADLDRGVCSPDEAIARGWAYQRGLLEGRLEAKAPASPEVKGAIISPLFPKYAPYRKDMPASPTRWTRVNDLATRGDQGAERQRSVERH